MLKFTKIQTIVMLSTVGIALLLVAVWAPNIQAAMLGNSTAPAILAQSEPRALDISDLTTQWEELQAQQQSDNPLPLDEAMMRMGEMLEKMQTLLAGEVDRDKQLTAIALLSDMTAMMRAMMAHLRDLPPSERLAQMPALMTLMQQSMGMMLEMPTMTNQEMGMMGGDMPMGHGGARSQMMGMMGNMMQMMSQMEDMSVAEHQAMMSQMMAMMQGMKQGAMMPSSEKPLSENDIAAQSTSPVELTQSAEAGAVMVAVTPLNLLKAQITIDFTVVLDTHSVDLGIDLSNLAVLQIGETEIAATAWDAPGEGGHHVEGILSFPGVDNADANILAGEPVVTLIIRDLAGVDERVFTWDLEEIADVPGGDSSATMPGTGVPGTGMPGMMGEGMGSSMPMTGTMPMGGDMSQMMGMMGNMMEMMSHMEGMPMAEHQAMMGQMMAMMQGMMTMMQGMPGEQMPMMAGAALPGVPHGTRDDHMAPIPAAGVPTATETVGSQPLAYQEEDGVKVFELTATPVRWTILDSEEEQVTVTAWTYNGTVPGPMIRVTEGDKVRIVLTNELPVPTSIHWHGIPVPNAMDGVPPFTQEAIQPGESFTYEFTAPPAGSFMYHSHVDTDVQIMVGLYAPFIVDPQELEPNPPAADVMWMLSEWRVGADDETYPAMPMAGAEPNYFTINGKAFPSTEPIVVNVGERVRIRLAGIGQFVHPMHLHGMNFQVIAYDGVSLSPEQQIVRNTIPINPGEIVDIEFIADSPGTWVFHCHVLHHVTNDNEEPGGLIGVIQVIE